MRHATILVAILAFTPLHSATAQVPVRPGERVRVTHLLCPPNTRCVGPRQESVGTFVAWKADSLVVQSNGDTLSVPITLVTRLDVIQGQKSFTLEGTVLGLLGGVVAGVAAEIAAGYEEGKKGKKYASFS